LEFNVTFQYKYGYIGHEMLIIVNTQHNSKGHQSLTECSVRQAGLYVYNNEQKQTSLFYCDQLATNHASALWCRHLYTLIHSYIQSGVSQCIKIGWSLAADFHCYGQFFEFPSHLWHSWLTHVHLTRGSAINETPTRCSVSVEVLSYCCTNDANRLHVWAFSATNTFYSTTSIVLYVHRCKRSTITQRACDDPHHLHIMLIWAIYLIPRLPWQPTLLMSTGP